MHKRSFENLTDLELHKKLLEYGLPNVPITETTRPLLIKKLKTHIQSSRRSERSSKIGIPTNEISNSSSSSHNNNLNNLSHYSAAVATSSTSSSTSTRPYQSLTAKELQNNTYTERASLPTSGIATATTISPQSTIATNRTYLNNLSGGGSSNIYKRYAPSSSDSEDDTPYGNSVMPHRQHFGVVGRLLNLRDNTLQYKKSPLTQHDYMDYANKRSSSIYNQTKPSYSSAAAAAAAAAAQQTFYQRLRAFARSWRGFKQLHIPHAIIFIFVLFLTIIVSVYLIKHPDITNLIRESNTHFTLCTDSTAATAAATGMMTVMKPLKNCLEQQQLTTAIEHSREIIQLLHKQAVQHHCVNHTLPTTLSTHEFVRHLVSAGNVWDMRQVLHDFQASVYLIKQNPQWNVRILSDVGTILTDTALQAYVAHGDTKFVLLKPNLPISCVLYNKLQRFFVITGIGALVFSACLIVYLTFRFIQQRRLEKQTTIGNFCTEIVNEVLYQATANEGQPHEVPLTHLRDKLIPLNKRKKLMKAWNEALKMLESYESRIQFVVSERNGEEVRCARWTGNLLSDSRDLSFRKQWQSPAFDNGNRICNPPTPCLKIRHMFDTTEVKHPNLKKVIEEAIFEKVGSRCNILDIQLDLSTCCVYVRCASEEDAGIVHNEINGWWFDKRLVSIKFLRLQRYLARFPESSKS